MKKVQEIIEQVKDFPTLPTIYTTLMEVIDNPGTTVEDLARIIMKDQSAATKILKAVNSPIYALKVRVNTISQAIFHLGFDEVKNLVIALSMLKMFDGTKAIKKFKPDDLWKHSIAVGVITRYLGKLIGIKKLENYFLAGVLHDIGKIFFLKYYNENYLNVIEYVLEHDITIRDAEAKIFGATHTVVGGVLAKKWRLPASIQSAVANHTEGISGNKAEPQVACVHVANILARALDLGNPGDRLIHRPNREIWKYLKLPPGTFVNSMSGIISSYEHVAATLMKKR